MTTEFQSPALIFPTNFCCNCGDVHCAPETQETRVTRFFGVGAGETTFRLTIPVCAACRRTTRRRPARFFDRLLVLALFVCACLLGLLVLGRYVTLPTWISAHLFPIGAVLGAIFAVIFYRLRRAKPPGTSFYQPVRIREADVQFAGVMGGPGRVAFMKLAFTNRDYLNAFTQANHEAIAAGHIAAVRA